MKTIYKVKDYKNMIANRDALNLDGAEETALFKQYFSEEHGFTPASIKVVKVDGEWFYKLNHSVD